MVVKYYYPRWGSEHMPVEEFLRMVKSSGFDGVEIALDPDKDDLDTVQRLSQAYGLDLLIQHPFSKGDTPRELLRDYSAKLEKLIALKPVKVNCHTGRDYYQAEVNHLFIREAARLSEKYGVPVVHEIHRGRFSFCTALIGDYLTAFPNLSLTADFSHWCVVSESLLEDQQEIVKRVVPHCNHIHARVGYAQGPQVPNPEAPEYAAELEAHLRWWTMILDDHKRRGTPELTVTCEFGPPPYLHTLPFSRNPVATQHEMNMFIKEYLTQNLSLC